MEMEEGAEDWVWENDPRVLEEILWELKKARKERDSEFNEGYLHGLKTAALLVNPNLTDEDLEG
jgi:hypothetical protein